MENKPALTQEQRLAYIGDMADLETREFLMEKVVKDLKERNNSMNTTLVKLGNECFALEQEKNQSYQVLQKNFSGEEPSMPVESEKPKGYDQYLKKYATRSPMSQYITIGGIIGRFFAFLGTTLGVTIFNLVLSLIGIELGSDLLANLERKLMQNGGEGTLAAFYIALSSCIAFCIIFIPYIIGFIQHCRFKKAYKKYFPYVEEHEQAHAWYIKALEQYKREKTSFEKDKEKHTQKYTQVDMMYHEKQMQLEAYQRKYMPLINANDSQITLLQESIRSIHSQKQDLYSIGIIPPDYREMDCVIMLHQIFRNGLKDNMADAILLYEERVYRQEIIRGIEKIYDMLGQLNDSMRAIESRLIEVKQELQMIGSDMSNQLAAIADNQSRILSEMEDASEAQAAYAAAQEQWQREQLAETRASRYAAEAVQRSNEKYEWYMEQHRQGLM